MLKTRSFRRGNSRTIRLHEEQKVRALPRGACNSYILIIFLTLCVLLTACGGPKITACPTTGAGDNCQSKGPEILNTRIEVLGQSSLHKSNTIWMHSTEQLTVLWDSYKSFITFGEATCDFPNLTEKTDSCGICNWCETGPSFERLCHFELRTVGGGERLRLLAFKEFMLNAEPTITFLGDTSGCSARRQTPYTFTPETNTAYQVLSPEAATTQEVLAEKKVFVISDANPSQPAIYELTPHTDTDTRFVWFKLPAMPMNNVLWEDNFTSHVRIGKVIIKKGKKITDPITGRFKLDETTATAVPLSHIRFFPSFQDGVQSASDPAGSPCWARQNTTDGDIDLSNCRPASNNNTGFLQVATPTYSSSSSDPLTWFVAFDPSAVPTLAADEVFAIEFTIQGI